jgi:steroid delta-isomerase-like uncharacterized protein
MTQQPAPRVAPPQEAPGHEAEGAVVGGPIDTLVGEMLAAWNAHDLDRVMACYNPAFQGIDVGEATMDQGLINVRKMVRRWFRAFPDLMIEAETLIVQNERVALGWVIRATHQSSFMRIPPTQRPVTIRGVSLMSIEGGLIIRASRIWDMAAFLRGVGLLPDLRADPQDEWSAEC